MKKQQHDLIPITSTQSNQNKAKTSYDFQYRITAE